MRREGKKEGTREEGERLWNGRGEEVGKEEIDGDGNRKWRRGGEGRG